MATRAAVLSLYGMLCVIWGSTWLAIRIGLDGTPPFQAAALRFALACAVLVPLVVWRRSKLPRTRQEWGLVVFVGIVLFTVDYGLIYWGENSGVQSGLSAILFATFVLQTAVFAHVLLKSEKLTPQKLAGIGLGFGGIVLIFRGELGAGSNSLLPMIAIVVSATCAAISSVATKRWGGGVDILSFTTLNMAVGTAGLLALSLAAREPWVTPPWPAGILAIVYLALAGSVVTFVTYWWLLKRIEATSMSYIAMVTPIVAVLLGVTVGNEVLDSLAILGAAITISGIYVSVSRQFSRRSSAAGATEPLSDSK